MLGLSTTYGTRLLHHPVFVTSYSEGSSIHLCWWSRVSRRQSNLMAERFWLEGMHYHVRRWRSVENTTAFGEGSGGGASLPLRPTESYAILLRPWSRFLNAGAYSSTEAWVTVFNTVFITVRLQCSLVYTTVFISFRYNNHWIISWATRICSVSFTTCIYLVLNRSEGRPLWTRY